MEKINIAELLKDCPKGMELDCLLCNNPIALEGVAGDKATYPIRAVGEDGFHHVFTEYGASYCHKDAKCIIFPKGKTTWEGFVPPCKFKDGDVIFTHANCLSVGLGNTWISIYKENRNGGVATYIDYAEDGSGCYSDLDGDKALLCMERDIMRQRIATKEEKEKLFQAIKDKGYKWNAETKTLENLIEPKFKVGDKIKTKVGTSTIETKSEKLTIIEIKSDRYIVEEVSGDFSVLSFVAQDDWELVPNKFDTSTLVPFESKVLVRDKEEDAWHPAIWGCTGTPDIDTYPYIVIGGVGFEQCIPYEGNEHLSRTTNDCDEFYKTWE